MRLGTGEVMTSFVVAVNPQTDTSLPYLLWLPIEGGLLLKARERWPTIARIYCHRFEESWPSDAEIVERTAVRLCRRRGAAIDLVLDRPRPQRSQFVFTQIRGREAIFWQTQKTARTANPGGRIPRRRTLGAPAMIAIDTRERYPYRFSHQRAQTTRETLAAGDYAVMAPDRAPLAAVERKSLDGLAAGLSDGTLVFQMQRLCELPLGAVVVEARYSAIFKLEHVDGGWLADQVARLAVRYPEVGIVFADTRRLAEDFTYRFLATALADASAPSAEPIADAPSR
jgi:ERCC4 domain